MCNYTSRLHTDAKWTFSRRAQRRIPPPGVAWRAQFDLNFGSWPPRIGYSTTAIVTSARSVEVKVGGTPEPCPISQHTPRKDTHSCDCHVRLRWRKRLSLHTIALITRPREEVSCCIGEYKVKWIHNGQTVGAPGAKEMQ